MNGFDQQNLKKLETSPARSDLLARLQTMHRSLSARDRLSHEQDVLLLEVEAVRGLLEGATQGPWEYGTASNCEGFYIAPRGTLPTLGMVERITPGNRLIVSTYNFPGSTEGNARLIAAAPDLARAYLALHARAEALERDLARERHLHSNTIDQRDRAQEAADRLAYALFGAEEIGEHSNLNCPWENAAERLEEIATRQALAQPGADAGEGA